MAKAIKTSLILISLCFFGKQAYSQEWFYKCYVFNFSTIKSTEDLRNYEFGFVEGSRTNKESLYFDCKNNLIYFSYNTMGGEAPFLVVEKQNDLMAISLKNNSAGFIRNDGEKFDSNNAIKINFNNGIFKISESEIIATTSSYWTIEKLKAKKKIVTINLLNEK